MGKTAVLGSGIVGTAAAWDLRRRGHDVVVADRDPRQTVRAAEMANAEAQIVDAGDQESVARLLDQVDLVISGVPYSFGVAVASAAISTGTHYLDFGGNPSIVRAQLELDGAAKKAGVTVVPDCGLAPGVANVLAAGVVESFAEGPIDELRLRVGALPQHPEGVLGYQLAFNPAGLINEYAEPCEVLHEGRFATEEPLTGLETVEWDPIGTLEAFHTAGGSSSLPRMYAGRVTELDYKTLRYPGHCAPFRAMLELGLFDETPSPATGVSPRSALLEALAANLPSGGDDLVLVRVWGRQGNTMSGYQMVDFKDDRFSALARTTAFPATALAEVILGGDAATGVASMDGAVKAGRLIAELDEVGIEFRPYPA